MTVFRFKMIRTRYLFIAILMYSGVAVSGSRLLATSGALQVEGASGGGIVPWAVITGYGSDDEFGLSTGLTKIWVDDFKLTGFAAAFGYHNRLELSYARQYLRVEPLDLSLKQDIFGAKFRLFGDVIYNALPQTSVGIQYKYNHDPRVPKSLGADNRSGFDYYLSATKLFLHSFMGRNTLLNGTLRLTEANQQGLLGFGRQNGRDHHLVGELTAAVFLDHHWVVGVEYRQKPDNLDGANENDWYDVFVGWFPNKLFAGVLAYSDLGDIAGLSDQNGIFLSLQFTP